MGVNKVDLSNGETIIDLTSDSVSPETLAEGETAHNSQGEIITGTMSRGGDMFKSTYDTDNNGKVDNADNSDKLGGQLPSYYAKASDIPSLEGYAKTSDIPSLDGYAKTSDIPSIPTKVSAFQNDAGYLTQHQDLSAYAKKTELPTALSQLSQDSTHRIVTDTEKATWNAKSNFSGNYNDLSNKPTIPTVPSSLPANGGNADTVDSYHIVVSSSTPTTNNNKIITFVV